MFGTGQHPSFHHHSILTAPETPINVTVQAKNTVGLGKPNSITLFTKEGGLYMFILYVHVLSKIKVDLGKLENTSFKKHALTH